MKIFNSYIVNTVFIPLDSKHLTGFTASFLISKPAALINTRERKKVRLGKTPKKAITLYGVRFGQTAVKLGFLTKEQLVEALRQQIEEDLANKSHRLIGEICFDRGLLTQEQIEIVLKELTREELNLF